MKEERVSEWRKVERIREELNESRILGNEEIKRERTRDEMEKEKGIVIERRKIWKSVRMKEL